MRYRQIKDNPEYAKYDIGEYTYGHPTIKEWDGGDKLHVGKFCSLAPNVTFCLGGQHHDDWVTTYPFHGRYKQCKRLGGAPYAKGDIWVGNDVWIGYNATILPGVTIGDGAIIGSMSVVAKNIPPYEVAVGNPIRVIRKRFSDEIIRKLLDIKWWDWPLDKVLENVPMMMSTDIEAFVNKNYMEKFDA